MRFVYMLIVSVVALAVSATLIGKRAQIERPDDGLYFAVGQEPETLNPLNCFDTTGGRLLRLVMEQLAERDLWTLDWKPALATHWEVSNDGLTHTFHLRRGVHWQDGSPFTADDVRYTWERIHVDPDVRTMARSDWVDCEACEVLDDYTVRFRWKQPYFLAFSLCAGLTPVSRHAFGDATGKAFNNHPIQDRTPTGTGPYRVERWETARRIVLVRNESYWGERPFFEHIVNLFVSEDQAVFQLFKKGEIDVVGLGPLRWARQSDSESFKRRFTKVRYPSCGYNFIAWNNDRVWFRDKRVRRAMTHLVNRELIRDTIEFGFGYIITGPVYPWSPAYDRTIEPIPYDPDAAKRLLDEAGWIDHDGDGIRDKVIDGERVRFDFEFTISGTENARATIFKEEFRKAGIRMRIRHLEWAVYLTHLFERNYDATSVGESMGLEVDHYLMWHSSMADAKTSANYSNFRNAEADALIERIRVTLDEDERIPLYHRFHAILHEEQPFTFLFSGENTEAYNRRLVNVRFAPAYPGRDVTQWRAVPRDQIDHSLPAVVVQDIELEE
ncbi:MAG: peptide-binding protein [Verrucomicrobia bacterium]|nr:peptide-binding protein [Verrucomicrobiota bacterium]